MLYKQKGIEMEGSASSDNGFGDGWLACSVLLLVWSQLKLIMSLAQIFASPKNTLPHSAHYNYCMMF